MDCLSQAAPRVQSQFFLRLHRIPWKIHKFSIFKEIRVFQVCGHPYACNILHPSLEQSNHVKALRRVKPIALLAILTSRFGFVWSAFLLWRRLFRAVVIVNVILSSIAIVVRNVSWFVDAAGGPRRSSTRSSSLGDWFGGGHRPRGQNVVEVVILVVARLLHARRGRHGRATLARSRNVFLLLCLRSIVLRMVDPFPSPSAAGAAASSGCTATPAHRRGLHLWRLHHTCTRLTTQRSWRLIPQFLSGWMSFTNASWTSTYQQSQAYSWVTWCRSRVAWLLV